MSTEPSQLVGTFSLDVDTPVVGFAAALDSHVEVVGYLRPARMEAVATAPLPHSKAEA